MAFARIPAWLRVGRCTRRYRADIVERVFEKKTSDGGEDAGETEKRRSVLTKLGLTVAGRVAKTNVRHAKVKRRSVLDDARLSHSLSHLQHVHAMSILNDTVYSSRMKSDISTTTPVNTLAGNLLSRKRKRDIPDPRPSAPSQSTKLPPRAANPLQKSFSESCLPPSAHSTLPTSNLRTSLPQAFIVRVRLAG